MIAQNVCSLHNFLMIFVYEIRLLLLIFDILGALRYLETWRHLHSCSSNPITTTSQT